MGSVPSAAFLALVNYISHSFSDQALIARGLPVPLWRLMGPWTHLGQRSRRVVAYNARASPLRTVQVLQAHRAARSHLHDSDHSIVLLCCQCSKPILAADSFKEFLRTCG